MQCAETYSGTRGTERVRDMKPRTEEANLHGCVDLLNLLVPADVGRNAILVHSAFKPSEHTGPTRWLQSHQPWVGAVL